MPLDERKGRIGIASAAIASCFVLAGMPVSATQVDIPGPVNSVTFGNSVTALPNGNFVVTDPDYGPHARKLGAVYLYAPTGALISTLRGRSDNDRIGSLGIRVLPNGNFLVLSPTWSNGKNASAGAVTWVDGEAGLSGVVSAGNSLVGTQADDSVGYGGITVLKNGNCVVPSYFWNNGPAADAGAVTWMDGRTGLTGAVSADNSLVGTDPNEALGSPLYSTLGVTALANGNYVVVDANWRRSSRGGVGAVMLADGFAGAHGTLSESNSLIGAQPGDAAGGGGIVALTNGNYVVSSPCWSNCAGAVTWVNGTTGLIATISAANSLVGSAPLDFVGSGTGLHPIVALTNGNYVVTSQWWSNAGIRNVGAATWGDGARGTSGEVSKNNSLVGSVVNDWVGIDRVAALSNGNYVVGSRYWHNGAVELAGAVTWADGTTGISGPVSTTNSLVGTSTWDWVGSQGTRALANGNYVVTSPRWNNNGISVGAITWAEGSSGLTGIVSTANSLIGSTLGDGIGAANVTALANGNYVVDSPFWNNDAATKAGAVTWADGATGLTGVVSASNSLVGTTTGDWVGYDLVTPLSNGNYVVASRYWSNGATQSVGAITWADGRSGRSGPVSAENSLIGISPEDNVGGGYEHESGVRTYANGTCIVGSSLFDDGSIIDAGAVSLVRGTGGTVGLVSEENSVIGKVPGGGAVMVFDYDPTHDTLIVGQPAANVVSLFKADLLYKNGFE